MTEDAPKPRRWRWWGEPGRVQPDVGDVLTYVDPHGEKPDWWQLVIDARQVRGRGPEDLWLTVTRHDFGWDYSLPGPIVEAIDGGATVFRAETRPRRR